MQIFASHFRFSNKKQKVSNLCYKWLGLPYILRVSANHAKLLLLKIMNIVYHKYQE